MKMHKSKEINVHYSIIREYYPLLYTKHTYNMQITIQETTWKQLGNVNKC